MATAIPTQLYEKVSEVEALSRNDNLNGQIFYEAPQEEALSRNPRQYKCEWKCAYGDLYHCYWHCL